LSTFLFPIFCILFQTTFIRPGRQAKKYPPARTVQDFCTVTPAGLTFLSQSETSSFIISFLKQD
jgi:hypothetical protein